MIIPKRTTTTYKILIFVDEILQLFLKVRHIQYIQNRNSAIAGKVIKLEISSPLYGLDVDASMSQNHLDLSKIIDGLKKLGITVMVLHIVHVAI